MQGGTKLLVAAALLVMATPVMALSAVTKEKLAAQHGQQMTARAAAHKAAVQSNRSAAKSRRDQKKALFQERRELRKQLKGNNDPTLRAKFAADRTRMHAHTGKGGN